MVGAGGHADAGTQVDGLVVQHQRGLEGRRHAFGHAQPVARVGGRQQHGELVAAEAGHEIALAHADLPQPLRHLLQHAVADLVAHHVVHVLEAVHVEHQHRDMAGGAFATLVRTQDRRRAGLGQGRRGRDAELRAVGQSGQAVPVGQAGDLALLGVHAHAHVLEGLGEFADLVVAAHLHGRLVVALTQPLGSAHQGLHRGGDAPRREDAAGGEHDHAQHGEHGHHELELPVGRHRLVDRAHQHRAHAAAIVRVEQEAARAEVLAVHQEGGALQGSRRGVIAPVGRGQGGGLVLRQRRGPDAPGAGFVGTHQQTGLQGGDLAHVTHERGADVKAHHHPADHQRRAQRHHHQLVGLSAQGHDLAGGPVAHAEGGALGQAVHGRHQRGRLLLARGTQGKPGVEQQRDGCTDALTMVDQHRADGVGVVGGHGGTKTIVGGEQRGPVAELLRVLREQAAEHTLAELQLLPDLVSRIARDAFARGQEAQGLHCQQQPQEQRHDAPAQPGGQPAEQRARRRPGRHQGATSSRTVTWPPPAPSVSGWRCGARPSGQRGCHTCSW
jgi:hypothetical protein